ncbi:MAG TPA: hypothetical protein VGB53_06855 [Rubricoccaceae bacterium]|jgi:DNA ligase-1
MPDLLFADLAAALGDIAAASGRLAKADRLAALLATATDDDAARVARYASGRVFPLADERTVDVGFASLTTAIATATGAEPDALRAALVRLGDPGDVAAEALGERPPSALPLAEIEAVFEAIAATRGSKARTALVAEALGRLGTQEARFFVRLLAGDLRTGMLDGGVELALARAHGAEIGAVQRGHMLTGDIGETAVLARHGRLGEAAMRPFHPVRFMLASPAEDAADVARQIEPPFLVEDKFDGIRAQAHVAFEAAPEHAPGVTGAVDLHGETVETPAGTVRVALFSRTLDAVGRSFPDLIASLAALARPGGLVLDGEIVPLGPGGRIAPFQSLQPRLGRKTVTAEMLRDAPVGFVVYDVLAAGGETLLDTPLADRRAALDALALPPADAPQPDVRLFRSVVAEVTATEALDAAFDAARARGNEGLMIKRPDSLYLPGRRGRDWLKLKKALATLDVVVVSVEVGNGGRRHLLSDLTFAVRGEDGTLLTVGKAYSGLTDAELVELTAWFEAHTLQTFAHGKVRTVEPEIVVEVAFDRVQPSPRHKSGFALRFPRIVRLRPDKPVAEIDTLATVAALAEA